MHKPSGATICRTLVLGALLAMPGLALASPTYPGTVADALGLPCNPDCTLCHTTPTGGFTTVNTPFGLTARMKHGLECCKPELLRDVLDELREAETDSDHDGVTDIDELEALTDPNDAADVDLKCTAPEDDSGCSVTKGGDAGSRDSGPVVIGFVVGLATVLVARRRLA